MGDVPLLVNFFLRRYDKKNDKQVQGITARAMDALASHLWPGNVRELENVIERAVVLSTDPVIDLNDLPDQFCGLSGISSERAMDGRGVYLPVGTSLEEAELTLLKETLKATAGDKNLAAKLLGVATRTIYRKLESIDKEQGQPEQDE